MMTIVLGVGGRQWQPLSTNRRLSSVWLPFPQWELPTSPAILEGDVTDVSSDRSGSDLTLAVMQHIADLHQRRGVAATVVFSGADAVSRAAVMTAAALNVPVVYAAPHLPKSTDAKVALLADCVAVPSQWAAEWYADLGVPRARIAPFQGPIVPAAGPAVSTRGYGDASPRLVYWATAAAGMADNAAALVDVVAAAPSADDGQQLTLIVRLTGDWPLDDFLRGEVAKLSHRRDLRFEVANPTQAVATGTVVVAPEDGALDALAAGHVVVGLSYLASEQLFGEYDGVAKVHSTGHLREALDRALTDADYRNLLMANRNATIERFVQPLARDAAASLAGVVDRIAVDTRTHTDRGTAIKSLLRRMRASVQRTRVSFS